MTLTLTRERRKKFEAIIQASDVYHYALSHLENLGQGQFAEQMVKDLANELAEAAESRTERKTDEVQGSYGTAYQRGEQERPDKVSAMLDLERNAPGAVRMRKVDELLSLWSVAFLVKTTNKRWRAFAEYAIDMQDKLGWEPKKFIEWVKRQDGYPTYWSQQRMEENYPKAFTEPTEPDWRDRSHAL